MADNINISPNQLNMVVGEVKQVQIQTEFPDSDWSFFIQGNKYIAFDKDHREVTALAVGFAVLEITLNKKQLNGTIVQEKVSTTIQVVEGEQTQTPIKIMLHNRATNRLVTMVGDAKDITTDITYKLPGKTGKLSVDVTLEDNSSVICRPVITNINENGLDENFDKIIQASEFKLQVGNWSAKHTKSTWEFALDKDFTKVVLHVEHERGNLTQCGHEVFGITCYVRVRYHSEEYTSPWSVPVRVTMTSDTPADSLRTAVDEEVHNNNTFKYYGVVPYTSLVDNYDYRGTYNTLFQYNLKDFKVGWQVEHEGKLYYAKQVLNANNVVTPGTDSSKWVPDIRENLPTIRLLLDMVGIGVGLADNNVDGYSTGKTSLGPLVNEQTGWMKFSINGKVFYTTEKSVCDELCWNDVAKRECAYGERTIRYGSRLYRVRLLREEEFLYITRLVTKGVITTAAVNLGDNTLIEDFQEGSERHTYSQVDNAWSRGVIDPKLRSAKYRPVLELIATGSEPWRHWDAGADADDENFRYDKFTDTGYFGVVPDSKLISGANLCTMIGLTVGSPINDGCGWLKFYWHGMVVYISKKSVRYNLTWKEMNNAKAHYPMDGQHELIKDNTKYIVTSPIATRAQPYVFDNFDLNHTPTYFNANNIAMDMAKYSMQQELIYRIQNGYVDGGTSDTVEWHKFAGTYKFWHGGLQKGDNWENFTSREQINLVAGSGSLGNGPYGRECTANRNTNGNSNCWGQFGAAGWNGNHSINHRDTDNGYMPCLIIRKYNT